jgi:hypothetical protein
MITYDTNRHNIIDSYDGEFVRACDYRPPHNYQLHSNHQQPTSNVSSELEGMWLRPPPLSNTL